MNMFGSLRQWVVGVIAAVCVVGFQSCMDDDDDFPYSKVLPNALVTVKPVSDGSYFLQLDDSTTLLPVNLPTSPFGNKEVRALVNFEESDKPSGVYSKAVNVNWIDSILTKSIAPDLGVAQNDSVYGADPVEIVRDWVTIAEDGYLTLRFRTRWGQSKPHFVNLLISQNLNNAYEVEFRHNAFGDVNGELADGLVAFKLDSLPDTNGKAVKLKLKWRSYSGEKSTEFNYCTRRSTPVAPSMLVDKGSLRLR